MLDGVHKLPARPVRMFPPGNTAERFTAPVIGVIDVSALVAEGLLKGCFELGYLLIPGSSLITVLKIK